MARLRAPALARLRAFAAAAAGVALLGAAALAVAPPEGRAEAPAVAVVDQDGLCTLRAVDPARLARIEAALAEEAERLQAMAGRLMADAAADRLAEAREQVPAFGAWAYDWVQSYVTSYRVLGRLVQGLFVSVQEGESVASLSERVMHDMAVPMREEFRRRVLPPDLAEGLAADLAHAAAVLDEAWQATLREAAAQLAEAPPATASAAPRLDLSAAARPLGPALAALAPPDALGVVAGEPADTAGIFMRSMRPMAARAGAAAVRASEVGSIIATATAFGYALAGAPGLAVGSVSGVGLSWAIDWGLNRIDAALNRPEFEAQALAALVAAERRLADRAAAATAAALGERVAALRPADPGCAGAEAGR